MVASLVFYAFSGPWYALLLLLSAFGNYLAGLYVHQNKWVLIAAVCMNLGILCFFKYMAFFARTLNGLPGMALPVLSIALPAGISFYTFQGMSYVIDVYRDERLKNTHFGQVLLYIALFPQLVAGPVVKYGDIASEINRRTFSLENVSAGLGRFVIGLSKKLLIADVCGSVVNQIYQASIEWVDFRLAWLSAIAYVLQIYFDFSGYSDMAIGLGLCFGFHFRENFRYPYSSSSIKEFWRRWHISISSWFRDYVYIPLGGNRRGTLCTYRNKLVVFFLTGLWHGANWTFVVWGLWHGAFLILEDWLSRIFPRHGSGRAGFLRQLVCRGYTLFVVLIGFVIFRADNLGQAWQMISAMFRGISATPESGLLWAQTFTPLSAAAMGVGILFSFPILPFLREKLQKQAVLGQALWSAILLLLLTADLIHLSAASYIPFIYFQF
ncbi:MAG: MBOAT family O-acyltransferase [Faecalibacterium sp.]